MHPLDTPTPDRERQGSSSRTLRWDHPRPIPTPVRSGTSSRRRNQRWPRRVLSPVAAGPYDCRKHPVGIFALRDEAASNRSAPHQRLVVWPVQRWGPSYAFAGCATTRTAVRVGGVPCARRAALHALACTRTQSPRPAPAANLAAPPERRALGAHRRVRPASATSP